MPVEVDSAEKLEELIRSKKLVLVAVYDSLTPQGKYVSGLVDSIAFTVEPGILIVKVDWREAPDLASRLARGRSESRLQLYLDGRLVWEQIGFFNNLAADKYAIRRGILNTLREYGYTPRQLGIRLRDSLEEL